MAVFLKDGSWWIDYYDMNGRRRRKKIGPQKTLAVTALKDMQVRRAKGEMGYWEDKKILFKDFAKVYVKQMHMTLADTTLTRCKDIIEKNLVPAFGQTLLSKITGRDVENYMVSRSKEVANATVNRELSRFRHMLSKAVKWQYIKENPSKGIKELQESPGRIRYLTQDELERLLTACDPACFADNKRNKTVSDLLKVYLKPIILLSCHLGTRRSELLSLTWKDINFRQRQVTLEHTKNGERRILPMNDTVYGVLKSLPVTLGNKGSIFFLASVGTWSLWPLREPQNEQA